MFLRQALDALTEAAQHPLALGMYVLVVVSWLVISLRIKRYRLLLRHLKKLPVKDRLKVLELEMGPLPKKGINAEQWLRSREQVFKLARMVITNLTIIIILTLAVFYFRVQASTGVSGRVTLDDEPVGNAIISVLGMSGQWDTNKNGDFKFDVVDVKSDSLTVTANFKAGVQTFFRDTTLSKNQLAGIYIKFRRLQTCIVAGQVIEIGTGLQVSGADVILSEKRGQGVTDSAGYFHFEAKGSPFENVKATVIHKGLSFNVGVILGSKENNIPFGSQ